MYEAWGGHLLAAGASALLPALLQSPHMACFGICCNCPRLAPLVTHTRNGFRLAEFLSEDVSLAEF